MSTSKLDDQTLMPFLKKDAIVNIKIGTGFLQQLSSCITVILQDKSEEDLKTFQEKVESSKELELWMSAVIAVQTLIRAVFEEADKNEMVEYKSIEESADEFISEVTEDNSKND